MEIQEIGMIGIKSGKRSTRIDSPGYFYLTDAIDTIKCITFTLSVMFDHVLYNVFLALLSVLDKYMAGNSLKARRLS